MAIVGRFAPSPSGRMHLGNAFAALLAWLPVRAAGGRMLLRIEDLDPQRSRPEYARQLKEDLEWLGLDWDAETRPQSGRGAFYGAQLEKLRAKGLLYPCFCTRAQLHAANAPHQSDGTPRYDGRCDRLAPGEAARMAQTRPAAVRVRLPDIDITLQDLLQGPYTQNLQREAGDTLLRRSDGVYAYQLAAPADDGDAGVNLVVRGRDLLPSAPRQSWLMEALGYAPPQYGHLPLLLAPGGRRLSKRDGDADLGALRQRLKDDPRPLLGWLAHKAGLLNAPEAVSAGELVPLFSWHKLRKGDITVSRLPESLCP